MLARVNVLARVMVLACVACASPCNVLAHVMVLYVSACYGVSTCYRVIPCSGVSLCYIVIPMSHNLRLSLSAFYD